MSTRNVTPLPSTQTTPSSSAFHTPPEEMPVTSEDWRKDDNIGNKIGETPNEYDSDVNLMDTQYFEEKELLQEELHYFFMSPIDKWRQRRQVPSKLIFQMLKIILVTIQLINFGSEMSNYMSQEENMNNAFRETLLYQWDPQREVLAYPPSTGPYAVYTVSSFYASLNFALRQYSNITNESVGLFAYPSNTWPNDSNVLPPISVERLAYQVAQVDPAEHRFNISEAIELRRLWILDIFPPGDQRWLTQFDVANYFQKHNFTIEFDSLIELRLVLPLRTIYFNTAHGEVRGHDAATCYDVNVTITYNNHKHDGMIPIQLTTQKEVQPCNEASMMSLTNKFWNFTKAPHHGRREFTLLGSLFGIVCISACLISTILCIRSLILGQLLRSAVCDFFRDNREATTLSWSDQLKFIDFWLLMIILNDVLNIAGTVMKILGDSSQVVHSSHFTACSLFLGVGNLLVWLGLLRYLSYFRSYNVIVLTLKRSVPHVLRFFICAMFIYCGFCCCGWVVLGPHHLKFRTLSRASECLFSLMNGDDMFATFFITEAPRYSAIWWFSRTYLYLFICLFIYVVVSLFIAIILDAYEAVVDLYEKNSSKEIEKTPLEVSF